MFLYFSVKDALTENIGNKLILQMDTGVNMEGIVSKVGKNLRACLEYFWR
jgi:hypothetical protein